MGDGFLNMMEALRANRDADSCLRGLNEFRKRLRGEEGPAFLARYLQQSPDWQELQAVWDAQLTLQHYHVTVTLLLALADALTLATATATATATTAATTAPAGTAPASQTGSISMQQQQQTLAAGAGSLVAAVLHRRMKALYFALSSEARGKANAALALLAAVAAAGSSGGSASAARDLLRVFDWSLSALPGLARPPREKKGETAAEHRQRYWQQWGLGDVLKRPTRAAFCHLALTLLSQAGSGGSASASGGDALLLHQLLQVRPLMGGLLNHLASDPPSHQLQVLRALQRRVLSARAGVPAAVQAEVFSDAALQQLAATAAAAGEQEQEEVEGEGEGATAAAEAAALSQDILLALATSPQHGLAASGTAAAGTASFVLAEAGSHQLLPGQRRLLRLLLRLRPADSAAHLQLLLAAAAADAPLAAALLLALPYSLEPAAAASGTAAAGRWFAHAAVAAQLLQLLPGIAPPGLLLAALSGGSSGGGSAPPPGSRQAQSLLRCCFPPCLHKSALSRGLQHPDALVRHGTLGLLVGATSALAAVLDDCTAAMQACTAALGGTGAGPAGAQSAAAAAALQQQQQQGWLALRQWLQQAARARLPDPTLLLALLAAADKTGWRGANELQVTAVLRLLLMWQRHLAPALLDASVDPHRLWPQDPLSLHPQHQLLLLELLLAAADASPAPAGAAAPAAAGAAAPAALLPPLRLLVAGGVQPEVRAAARRWLLQRLLSSAAFSGNEEEAVLWVDLLPRGSEAAARFLAEAFSMLLRRPHDMYEQQQALLAEQGLGLPASASTAQHPQEQFSLLALCALRQLLRVLPSGKIPDSDKADMASYVAGGLRQLAQQQLGAASAASAAGSGTGNGSSAAAAAAAAAPLAAVLLGVVRQEAARQQQQQQADQEQANGGPHADASSKKGGKRKQGDGSSSELAAPGGVGPLQLVPAGRPLLALLADMEAVLQGQGQGQQQEEAQEQATARKKARKSKGEAAAVAASAGTAGTAGSAMATAAAVLLPGEPPDTAAAPGEAGCCLLVSQLAGSSAGNSSNADALAAVQQLLSSSIGGTTAGTASGSSSSGSSGSGSSSGGVGTCSATVRQCLHWLELAAGQAAACPALLQVLQAAVLAAVDGGCSAERQRCAQLLAGSCLAAAALADGSRNGDGGGSASRHAAEVAAAVVQLPGQLLAADVACVPHAAPLLDLVAAAFQQALADSSTTGSASGAGSRDHDAMPLAVGAFLLLLPHMSAAAVEAAAHAVVEALGPAGRIADGGISGKEREKAEKKENKEKKQKKAEYQAALKPWVSEAAAALLRQLVSGCGGGSGGSGGDGSGDKLVPQLVRQACGLLLQQAAGHQEPAASDRSGSGSSSSNSSAASLLSSLQHALSGSQQAAVLEALGCSGRQQLLRCCLNTQAGGADSLVARAQTAALLVTGCSDCRQMLLSLLPDLLAESGSSNGGGGSNGSWEADSAATLALLLPASVALLEWQQQRQRQPAAGPPESAEAAAAETAAAEAALGQALLSYFATAVSGKTGEEQQGGGVGSSKGGKKKAKKDKHAAGSLAAPSAAAEAAAALLQQHALPALRLVLGSHPPAAAGRQQLLKALLPALGWPVSAAGSAPGSSGSGGSGSSSSGAAHLLLPSPAEQAEAAVLLLLLPAPGTGGSGSSSSASTAELVACVRCFAATLSSLLKLPAGSHPLEACLLTLLDGPVGDAVAALPSAQRSSAAFAELAGTAAGTLGTAVLRHRLAAAAAPGAAGAEAARGAQSEGAADAAAAAAAGLAAVRVLRRFLAALLPDEEEEEAEEEGEQPSSSSDSDSESDRDIEDDSSSSSGSEGRRSNRHQRQQHQQGAQHGSSGSGSGSRSPAVATAALQLLQRLLGHSRFLPAMRAGASACPPPLPPAAAALQRPLASLLPLAAAAVPDDVAGGTAGGTAACPAAAEAAQGAAELKKELCELIETLLDLHSQFSGDSSDGSSRGGGSSRALQEERQAVEAAEGALLPLLMAGYGASCSPADTAAWSLAALINQRQWARQQRRQQQQGGSSGAVPVAVQVDGEEAGGGGADVAAVEALLHGPLARTCFAWGPAAAALQQLAASGGGGDGGSDEQHRQQQQVVLLQRLPLDPVRAALTVCHWPESCSLAAPGSSSSSSSSISGGGGGAAAVTGAGSSGSSSSSSSGLAQLPSAPAGYDPGFLLPFCCAALRHGLLPPRAFAEAGLMSVCLRGLAAADASCRAASYQALALLESAMAAPGAPDFREKQQLSLLLGVLRSSVTRPFQRLPAVHAVLLAEAAMLALHPGHPMYPAANRHLTRRAVLSFTEVPLLGQLLLSGGQQHPVERRWMMQLLLAGLRTAEDAALYRRKHVFELAMSLHDSSVGDPSVTSLARRLVCSATYIPRAARQLSQECGLIPWLAATAETAIQRRRLQQRQQVLLGWGGGEERGGASSAATSAAVAGDDALLAALAALRRLLRLRTVMRGQNSAATAQQLLMAARQLASAALAAGGGLGGAARCSLLLAGPEPGSTSTGSTTSAPAALCSTVLPFLAEVQQQVGSSLDRSSSSGGGTSSLAAAWTAQALVDMAAAASIIQQLAAC